MKFVWFKFDAIASIATPVVLVMSYNSGENEVDTNYEKLIKYFSKIFNKTKLNEALSAKWNGNGGKYNKYIVLNNYTAYFKLICLIYF